MKALQKNGEAPDVLQAVGFTTSAGSYSTEITEVWSAAHKSLLIKALAIYS
jgi:hypothetical protein